METFLNFTSLAMDEHLTHMYFDSARREPEWHVHVPGAHSSIYHVENEMKKNNENEKENGAVSVQ